MLAVAHTIEQLSRHMRWDFRVLYIGLTIQIWAAVLVILGVVRSRG